MGEVATINQERALPSINAGGAVRAIVPQTFDEAYRIAKAVVIAGMAPRDFDTAERCMVALLHGAEVGLPPMQALQSIAVINGRPSIWGDGAMGLVRGSGILEYADESIEGDGDSMVAICTVKRRGEPKEIVRRFSVADAKAAGLWSKAGPWKQYPRRMLQMRARAFALRDGFADVLRGLHIAEEAMDIPDARQAPTPPSPPSPPPAPKVIEAKANTTEKVENKPTDPDIGIPDFLDRTKGAPAHDAKTVEIIEPEETGTEASGLPPCPGTGQPEAFLEWVNDVLGTVTEESGGIDALETLFNSVIDPHREHLFPPDQGEVDAIYERHQKRFEP